jgi:malonate transporter
MESVLKVTGPIYLLVAVGFLAIKRGWMASADMRILGRFVAQFSLPALLFGSLARRPIAQVLHADYLAVYAAGSALSWGLTLAVSRWGLKRPLSLAAIQGMGAACSNSAFVGFPIVQQVIGPAAGVALALGALVENLLMVPLSLIVADAHMGEQSRLGVLKASLGGLLRNPMVMGIAAGLLVSSMGWPLPVVLDKAVAMLGAAAPPTALFVIGGSLVGLQIQGIRTDIVLVVGGKLLLHPLCVLGFMMLMPLADPVMRAAAVLFSAMPMMSIYAVLAQRHGHEKFCAAALLAATVCSFFTLSGLIMALPPGWLPAR